MATPSPKKRVLVDEISVEYDPDTRLPSFVFTFKFSFKKTKQSKAKIVDLRTRITFTDIFDETPGTLCIIAQSGPSGYRCTKRKYTGTSFLSPNDSHSVSTGMKFALERAVQAMFVDNLSFDDLLGNKDGWWKPVFSMFWSDIRYAMAYAGYNFDKDDVRTKDRPVIKLVGSRAETPVEHGEKPF